MIKLVLFIYSLSILWLGYEVGRAPEMYFDKNGNFRRREWFIENDEFENAYYDENLMEKVPVRVFSRRSAL